MSYDPSDCADDPSDDLRDEVIDHLIGELDGFAWRWRIVQSGKAKRCAHLEKWCEEAVNDCMADRADHEMERSNPYRYYGISRSSFG